MKNYGKTLISPDWIVLEIGVDIFKFDFFKYEVAIIFTDLYVLL